MRIITKSIIIAAIGVLAAACQGPFGPDVSGDSVAGLTAARTAEGGSAITRLDDGMWIHQFSVHPRYQPHGWAFWVDAQVQNVSPEKQVTIIWTDDNWETVNETAADFKQTLADGSERWGADVYLPQGFYEYPGQHIPLHIEYALRLEANGDAQYDPGNNYFLGELQGQEVNYIGGAVKNDESDQTVFRGSVVVENIAYEKQVTVVYTTDGWNTTDQVEAEFENGNAWLFDVDMDGTYARELEFAVRYIVAGETYWDNNDGQNYKYQIGPNPQLLSPLPPKVLELDTSYTFRFRDGNINSGDMTVHVNGTPLELDEYNRAEFYPTRFIRFPQFKSQLKISVSGVDEFGFSGSNEYVFEVR